MDLAAILGFHSMMTQDQWHESHGTKFAGKADANLGWDGITKATPLKWYPPEEPNRWMLCKNTKNFFYKFDVLLTRFDHFVFHYLGQIPMKLLKNWSKIIVRWRMPTWITFRSKKKSCWSYLKPLDITLQWKSYH